VLLAARRATEQLRLLGVGPPVRRILDAVGLGLTLTRDDAGQR
jgi:anti-anti-sigma regulatory factor